LARQRLFLLCERIEITDLGQARQAAPATTEADCRENGGRNHPAQPQGPLPILAQISPPLHCTFGVSGGGVPLVGCAAAAAFWASAEVIRPKMRPARSRMEGGVFWSAASSKNTCLASSSRPARYADRPSSSRALCLQALSS